MHEKRSNGRKGRCLALTLALALASLGGIGSATGDSLFKQPSIGLDPPKIIQPVRPSTVPALGANQCQLAAGTCPLGRLQRSGTRCYCATTGGGALQGATRTRPQGARPSMGE